MLISCICQAQEKAELRPMEHINVANDNNVAEDCSSKGDKAMETPLKDDKSDNNKV